MSKEDCQFGTYPMRLFKPKQTVGTDGKILSQINEVYMSLPSFSPSVDECDGGKERENSHIT